MAQAGEEEELLDYEVETWDYEEHARPVPAALPAAATSVSAAGSAAKAATPARARIPDPPVQLPQLYFQAHAQPESPGYRMPAPSAAAVTMVGAGYTAANSVEVMGFECISGPIQLLVQDTAAVRDMLGQLPADSDKERAELSYEAWQRQRAFCCAVLQWQLEHLATTGQFRQRLQDMLGGRGVISVSLTPGGRFCSEHGNCKHHTWDCITVHTYPAGEQEQHVVIHPAVTIAAAWDREAARRKRALQQETAAAGVADLSKQPRTDQCGKGRGREQGGRGRGRDCHRGGMGPAARGGPGWHSGPPPPMDRQRWEQQQNWEQQQRWEQQQYGGGRGYGPPMGMPGSFGLAPPFQGYGYMPPPPDYGFMPPQGYSAGPPGYDVPREQQGYGQQQQQFQGSRGGFPASPPGCPPYMVNAAAAVGEVGIQQQHEWRTRLRSGLQVGTQAAAEPAVSVHSDQESGGFGVEGPTTATAAAAMQVQSSAEGMPALVAHALANVQTTSLQHLIDSSAAQNMKLGEVQAKNRALERQLAKLKAQCKELQDENVRLRHQVHHPFGIADIPR